MDTYLTIFAALVAFGIGLAAGILWQAHSDGICIRALELQRNDAHEEMVAQEWCCERVQELEARVRELEQELVEIYRDDDDDDLGDDPPQSVVYVYRRTPTAHEIARARELDKWLQDEAMLRNGAQGAPHE